MATTRDLLDHGTRRLREAGSDTPRLDAELLLGFANGVDRTAILAHPEAPVGDGPATAFEGYLTRRATGEPVAYIRGLKEFHGLAFSVDPRALIPRPETEQLVDLAVTEVMARLTAGAVGGHGPGGGSVLSVLDVGTGSGAITIALAVELRRRRVPADEVGILAVDISADALDLARENAVGHGVADRVGFAEADLVPPDGGPWDVVLANLPYVRNDAMASLPRATTFEPALALDGGPAGLAVIGRLLDRLPTILYEPGVALLEIGSDQEASIVALAAERLPTPGWTCRIERDLAGLPRVARLERAGTHAALDGGADA